MRFIITNINIKADKLVSAIKNERKPRVHSEVTVTPISSSQTHPEGRVCGHLHFDLSFAGLLPAQSAVKYNRASLCSFFIFY